MFMHNMYPFCVYVSEHDIILKNVHAFHYISNNSSVCVQRLRSLALFNRNSSGFCGDKLFQTFIAGSFVKNVRFSFTRV